MGSRIKTVIGALAVAISANLGNTTNAAAAPAASFGCWECPYTIFYGYMCMPNIDGGWEDCFGPMLPSLPCSVYGQYKFFCFDSDGEAVVGADGTTLGTIATGARQVELLQQERARVDAASGREELVTTSCKGSVLAQSYAEDEARALTAQLAAIQF